MTHHHTFNGPFPETIQVSRYQKSKTNLDFTEARDSEWQWHQLGHMQVCTSLQTDNHASTSPLSFLQAGCPSCRPNNSVKASFNALMHALMHTVCANSDRDKCPREKTIIVSVSVHGLCSTLSVPSAALRRPRLSSC